ncbi:MAG: rhodanese-like domain-containing protein [Flavobacteriales bacterium]
MIEAIKKMLGIGPATDFKKMMTEGALIVDVRTKEEFASGHIKGAVNIPLNQLSKQLGKIKSKEKPVITCCASGMRSTSAKSILKANGFNAYNGGGWQSLKAKLHS